MPILFADDTNLFYSASTLANLESCINSELSNISTWLKVNELSLNIKKIHYIIFHKKKEPFSIEIKIYNEKIEQVYKTKFLGVVIDPKLSWKNHIALVSGKLSRSIGMIIKARQCLNRKALTTLYYSFFYPYLTYCNHVWGSTYTTHTMKLFIVQKKVIRIIYGIKRRESTETAFTDLKIMKFPDINMFLIGRFMFRLRRGEVPDMFSDFFIRNAEIHDYSTRQRQHFHVPSERSNLGKFSIRYRGTIVWNLILKLDINPDTSEAVFIKTIKKGITNGSLCFWYLISHRIVVPVYVLTHYGWNFANNIFSSCFI